MASIGASVGEGGANRKADVRAVQQLLTDAGHDPQGVDGDYGDHTRDAILAFQKTFLGKPDGLIEPGGVTIRRLQKAAADRAATAPAAPAKAAAKAPAKGAAKGPAKSTDWSGDSTQWSQEKKLASLAPAFRPKVERVIEKLKLAGYRPTIRFGWRSVEVQEQLKAQGNSPLSFSFHTAQQPDGTPCAWAVDLIDSRWAWNEPDCHKFFRALGPIARAEGLVWGGDWSKPDWAHIQGRQNSELAQVKRESGLA
jgi:putative peptidoglycan binding protein